MAVAPATVQMYSSTPCCTAILVSSLWTHMVDIENVYRMNFTDQHATVVHRPRVLYHSTIAARDRQCTRVVKHTSVT